MMAMRGRISVLMMACLSLTLLASLASASTPPITISKRDESGMRSEKRDTAALTKEIYTSMHELTEFLKKEIEYVNDLRVIVEKQMVEAEVRGALNAYIASFEDIMGQHDPNDQVSQERFLRHPVNVYHLIRHVAVGWMLVEQELEKEEERKSKLGSLLPKRCAKVLKRRVVDHVPGSEDLDGVSVGIVRLHDYYHFNLSKFIEDGSLDLPQGIENHLQKNLQNSVLTAAKKDLSVWDAFKIGVKGANNMFLGSGIDIMLTAFQKASNEGSVSTPPFIEAMDMKVLKNLIKTAKTVHDQKLDRWGPRTTSHSTNPIPYDKRLAKKKKFSSKKKSSSPKVVLNSAKIVETPQETLQYMELCRGHDLRPLSVTKNLMCKYESRNKAYFIIGPIKVEIVSLTPYIVVMHEFVMDKEIKQMLHMAKPKLMRSTMLGTKLNGTLDERRVSEQTWLTERDSSAAFNLSRRIHAYLELDANSSTASELYQVANYGLAGQYAAHYDQVLMTKDSLQQRSLFNIYAGDRMATLMGYLSDVEAGGLTVFPLVGAFVRPQRGSMVLWWNMDKAGGYDALTRHGGCPVLVGNKWITNKWIRSNSQMFNRPCPTYTNRQIRDFRNSDPFNVKKGGSFNDP